MQGRTPFYFNRAVELHAFLQAMTAQQLGGLMYD